MTRDEIRRLLGGYATGTLTADEQQALFEAALEDQELFDELAREQPLRDLLRDPAARAHLLASIEEEPRPWWRRMHRRAWIGAAAIAVAASLTLAVILRSDRSRPAAAPTLVAEVKPEPVGKAALSPPAALPAEPARKETAPVKEPRAANRPSRPPATRASAAAKKEAAAPQAGVSALQAAAPPRAKAEAADKDTNLSTALPAPAALPPPPPQAAPTAAPGAAIQMQSLGGLGGAPPAAPQDARALFYAQPEFSQTRFLESQNGPTAVGQFRPMAMPAGSALMVPNPGVKWTALRKQEDGLFSQVDPEQIKAGDIIRLRLVPNDNGYLSVMDGRKPLVAERRVVRLEPVETPEISGGAGKRELTVVLSRRAPAEQRKAEPEKAQSQPQTPQVTAAGLLRPVAGEQLSQADRSEHAVYEVKRASNPLTPVLVRITLTFH